MALTQYTIAAVNAKAGSIVVSSSTAPGNPEYYLNLKSVKVQGSNPFLADGLTTNPNATVSICSVDKTYWIIKDLPLNQITSVGGSPTPATLALTLTAIAALIAE